MRPDFLREAIALAREGVARRLGGPFGALVVRGDRILARGQNRVTSALDPTAHAEIVAIREACRAIGSFRLEGCELYASCEPCPMCRGAILWARLDRVYYAAGRDDAEAAGFDDALFHREAEASPGARPRPMTQHLRDEGLAPFRDWAALSDRVLY